MRWSLAVKWLFFLSIAHGTVGWCAQGERVTAGGRLAPVLYRQGVLADDTAWSGEVIVEGGMTVAPQTTLTIQPGTMVKFVRGSTDPTQSLPALMVLGRLVVNGTPEQPVVFTGNGQEAASVSWQGILLVGSEKNNSLVNARIKGAKVGIDVLFSRLTLKSVWADRCGVGMRGQDALIEMQGGGVSGCGLGLQLFDTESSVRGMQIQGNRRGIVTWRGSIMLSDAEFADNEQDGLQVNGSRLSIERNRLLRNGNGMVIDGGEGLVKGNRVAGQRGHGVVLTNARVRFRDNVVTENTLSGLVVRDGRGVAYANALHKNGQFDVLNEGQEEFRAPGNWWGGEQLVEKRLGGSGPVIFVPVLPQAPPAP